MPTTPRHRDRLQDGDDHREGMHKSIDYGRPGARGQRIVNGRIGASYEDDDGNVTYDVVVWGGWPLTATGEIVEGALAWGQTTALEIDTAVQVMVDPPAMPQIMLGAGSTVVSSGQWLVYNEGVVGE